MHGVLGTPDRASQRDNTLAPTLMTHPPSYALLSTSIKTQSGPVC